MKKKTYYFVEDDAFGQHGTTINEVKLTKDEYLTVCKTRLLNNQRGFITANYISALYYTQD